MSTKTRAKLCPFIKYPYKDCYCISLCSQGINRAVQYCSNDYQSCHIFRRGLRKHDLNAERMY